MGAKKLVVYENDFMDEALALAEEKGLKAKIIGGDLYIDSIFDAWYVADYGKYIALHHKNTLNNNYHLQRRFTNVLQAVDSIVKHDVYKLNR